MDNIDKGNVNPKGLDLRGRRFTALDLINTNLSGADFRGANLCGINLRKKNLSGVNFGGVNLNGADFEGADISGANFEKADLSWANLRRTNIDKKTVIDPKYRLVWEIVNQDSREKNFSKADLSRTNLREIDFTLANLSKVDFSKADLSGVSFILANLNKSNFSGTYLGNTNFDKADLSSTILDPNAKIPSQDLSDWEIWEDGLLRGWRSENSPYYPASSGFKYIPGRTYVAPVFSLDISTVCHPGLHVCTSIKDAFVWGYKIIEVAICPEDIIQSMGKWRCRKFKVIKNCRRKLING
jgi:uncharacterized protein YjbI with pentapeptide repeats